MRARRRAMPALCDPIPLSFFIGWLAEAAWLVFANGHALGAVFNQLVRSRAQLLVEE